MLDLGPDAPSGPRSPELARARPQPPAGAPKPERVSARQAATRSLTKATRVGGSMKGAATGVVNRGSVVALRASGLPVVREALMARDAVDPMLMGKADDLSGQAAMITMVSLTAIELVRSVVASDVVSRAVDTLKEKVRGAFRGVPDIVDGPPPG